VEFGHIRKRIQINIRSGFIGLLCNEVGRSGAGFGLLISLPPRNARNTKIFSFAVLAFFAVHPLVALLVLV